MEKQWHIIKREDGSIGVYYTFPDDPTHYVVISDIDLFFDAIEKAKEHLEKAKEQFDLLKGLSCLR